MPMLQQLKIHKEIVVVKSIFVPPAPMIVMTFPTSAEVKFAVAEVKLGVPDVIAPSYKVIPSPLAPYCLILNVVDASNPLIC